jgi:tRNA nucleotidyltransferase (CCA-adding enzyme)
VRLAAGHPAPELLLAAAAGGSWVDDYAREWSLVKLEIGGEDLMAAGIPEGPAVGAGLRGALERKLDGGLTGGREAELELALELARRAI